MTYEATASTLAKQTHSGRAADFRAVGFDAFTARLLAKRHVVSLARIANNAEDFIGWQIRVIA
jgi:hypothetical protein